MEDADQPKSRNTEESERNLTPFDRDLRTLSEVGPIMFSGDVKATPCLRLDLAFSGPIVKRPGRLGEFLSRAERLMRDSILFYGGSSRFAASRGRKPKPSDFAQLAQIEKIMALDTHVPTRSEDSLPEVGTLFLSDGFPEEESGNHILLRGTGGWSVSLSFSLVTIGAKGDDIFTLAEELMRTGVAESATFSFAYNTREDGHDSLAAAFYQPFAVKFPLLNLFAPGTIALRPYEHGILPIGSWYYLDHSVADEYGVSKRGFSKLEGRVHTLEDTGRGHFVKLYEKPILGGPDQESDLSPAFALGAILDPAFKKYPINNGVTIGDPADRIAWLTRFGMPPSVNRTVSNCASN